MENLLNQKNIDIILDYVSDGIQIINKDGKLVYCNRASAIVDDINRGDVIGKHLFHVYPSLEEQTSFTFRVLRTGIPIYNVEQTYTNYRNKKITTINSTFPIKDSGEIVGAIEISRNITDVKALSEKLIDLQNQIHGGKIGKV